MPVTKRCRPSTLQPGWTDVFQSSCGTSMMFRQSVERITRWSHGTRVSIVLCGMRHLNIYVFVKFLQREEHLKASLVHNTCIGVHCHANPSKYTKIGQHFQQLYDAHAKGEISTAQLLLHARHPHVLIDSSACTEMLHLLHIVMCCELTTSRS